MYRLYSGCFPLLSESLIASSKWFREDWNSPIVNNVLPITL